MNALASTSPSVGLPPWPEFALVDDLLPTLRQWSQAGRRIALATLVRVTGSPRPLGSEMAIAEDGEVVGYVSGGCVEAAVRAEALACIHFRMSVCSTMASAVRSWICS
jgi:xanthine dehydrogenase accessory factor